MNSYKYTMYSKKHIHNKRDLIEIVCISWFAFARADDRRMRGRLEEGPSSNQIKCVFISQLALTDQVH